MFLMTNQNKLNKLLFTVQKYSHECIKSKLGKTLVVI